MIHSLLHLLQSHGERPFLALESTVISYASFVAAVQELSAHLDATLGSLAPHSVCVVRTANNALSLQLITALLEQRTSVVLANTRWPEETLAAVIDATEATHFFDSTTDSLEAKCLRSVSSLGPALGDTATIVVATSGTTATPKLAVLPLEALYWNAEGANRHIPLAQGDCWSLSLPLFHVGGLGIFFRTVLAGSAIALTQPHAPLPTRCALPITHLSLVPTQLYRLLMKDDTPALKQLSAVLLGGAPLPAALINRALARGIPLFTTYGLTEMGSQVTCQRAQQTDDDVVAPVGTALPHRELSISDSGEILVRGKSLFAGYIVANTIEPHRDDAGWFHTRDVGRLTSAGDLLVVGRADAQFISGGENIHPEMIEAALTSLPYIEAACVVPCADEEFGQRPYAFVVTPTGEVNEEEIRAALRHALPSFALPKRIVAAPSEMMTASGKLSKGVALNAVKAL